MKRRELIAALGAAAVRPIIQDGCSASAKPDRESGIGQRYSTTTTAPIFTRR
jgi:hypothetical protein